MKKKVVIVGGGFAGLHAAKGLAKSDFEIIVIDKTNHHLFQPLLYQVATAALSPANIAIPLREVLRGQKNTTVLMGEVVDIHKDKRQIILENGEAIDYDYLILATGARHSYFGNDEWEKYAPGLKTAEDALTIREMILSSFEKAERCSSPEEAQKFLNFAIIGGGPTGVELAGTIASIARKTMLLDFRRIMPSLANIYIIDLTPHLLPTFPEALGEKSEEDLKKLGVRVITNQRVTDITKEGIFIGERFIEARNIIWAAGNQASPLLKCLNVPLNRQGQVKVKEDLTIEGHPEIFVLGDAAEFLGGNGKPLPAIAPVALQQGKWVAKHLRKNKKKFTYFDKGLLATIGRYKAVGTIGKHQLHGFNAWIIWGTVHISYLVGFRNRLMVLTQWFFSLLTNRRSVRLLHHLKYRKKEK